MPLPLEENKMKCPYCGETDDDKIVGMGKNMLLCESCDKEFNELEMEEEI